MARSFWLGAQCAGSKRQKTRALPTRTLRRRHSHGDGPNGGVVTDWGGGKYHVEFCMDHKIKQATVYILGSDARNIPIKTDKLRSASRSLSSSWT